MLRQTQGQECLLAFTPQSQFLYPQAIPPLPQSRHQTQQQPKQTDPKQAGPTDTPAEGPQPVDCCLATRCQEPQGSQSEGAWRCLALHHCPCFSICYSLLWVSSFHFGQKQQGQCLVTPTGPALLVWLWTYYTKQILGLNTQLRQSVSPCSRPSCL